MRRKRAQRKRGIPEALGNRICGVWLYVLVLVFDAAIHASLLIAYGFTPGVFFRIFFSFIFFIYPLYFVADQLWSLRPSVCGMLSGEIEVNRKYYMNTAREEVIRDSLYTVTISVPIYMESNEIIFRTLKDSLMAVRRYSEIGGKEANVVVSDDGLAPLMGGCCTVRRVEELARSNLNESSLTAKEKQAAERIRFYRENGIAFVARPAGGRSGLFKKGSNLNYTMRLGRAVADGASPERLFQEDGEFPGGYAEGDFTTHEIILLLDKDSGVRDRIIEAVVPEFVYDDKLAYVQCSTRACNIYENYYTYATGHHVNNLFHNIWPCKALQGFFVPLVGHNVFIRRNFLEKSGLWSESRVSEDYDKAIEFYGMGYHGKYAQMKGLEFTEYASRTFTEETGKQRRYAYGLCEMIFDGTISPGRTRGCDAFYMFLYFCSAVNQALLLPTIFFESYFGNIHLLWAGFLFCMMCFVLIPVLRGFVMRRLLHAEYSEKFAYTVIIALSFVGHSFSSLSGTCRYLSNKIVKIRKPFPSTNVDIMGYRIRDGVNILKEYICGNPLFLVVVFFCLDRGAFFVTRKGLESLTAVTYSYILFCAVIIPVLLTPQLFPVIVRKTATLNDSDTDEVKLRNEKGIIMLPAIIDKEKTGIMPENDVDRFLSAYRETLLSSLPHEEMPEELMSEYIFESCLRKDSESRKEVYILRRKEDNARALLRITKDYPEEDALEEASLLRRLDHPGIPKVYASYEHNGKRYIVREYVEGRTLHEIISNRRSLTADDIFGIALKLAEIIRYLHMQTPPVIHRDIKPQNVIAGRDGSIHLIDFGIARRHKLERRKDTSVILTREYASPEQYGFEQTTPLSDIYSFGMLLLFLATGSTERSGLEAKILNNRLRGLIWQCIAFNPGERVQSAGDLCDYLVKENDRRAHKADRRIAVAAVLLAGAVALSALSYGTGYIVERVQASGQGYERGYEEGYTEGYDAMPVFRRNISGTGEETGKDSGNMAVPGAAFATADEDYVFYIAEGGIWRMSAKGTDTELFVRDESSGALSCHSDWLYYSSGDRIMQTNIYTRRSDVLCSGKSGDIHVTGKRFYIRSNGGVYLLNAKTGDIAALGGLTDCRNLNTDGKNLYYIRGNDNALYRSDPAGNDVSDLRVKGCRSICLQGNYVFCSVGKEGEGQLIRVNLSTGDQELLLDAEAAMLNVTDDGLFFIDESDGTIRRCSFDGRIRERVSANRAGDFNIAGGWIFYHNVGDDGKLWCVRLDGANDHPVLTGR